MHQKKADYTNTFCYLMNVKINDNKNYEDQNFQNWKTRWNERLKINNNTPEKFSNLMKNTNPVVIPRNHKVEEALLEATEKDNLKPVNQLLEILRKPYSEQKNIADYQIPSNLNKNYQTFCGT